ncbi:hypothetical protein CONLIGDRAFT_583226 [Coniochaeta ligniaria NRRL 30616]|uniref:Uncharacterized protein n=1 Tax=Coniochaeta ligniaria NRRL 30616 TaxID=1408157 RepID=A0A1J7IBJ4_9PEZI|nr:hypothetical protein CONLIGDRAFT_583226 [Coniochaeta ligniaria NRRL 30616]
MSETPSKGDAESTSPYQTIKDKKCPFCNKDFTSSSLGRHLDLWIKDKNPKPADGLHNVDEIRKMRGGVTRRQHKKSLGARRLSSTSVATSAATPIAASKTSPAASEHVDSAASPMARKDSAPAIPGFNVHNFAATGVINNIEHNRAPSTSTPSREVAAQQTKVSQLNMDMVKKIQDAEDTARAAELALREMVSSWRAAKLQIDMSSMPFDFDPLSLDFSALTLQCLQPPPTLSSFNPFPTESSWSIQLPGQQQFTALQAYFAEEFRKWRIKCAAATTALQEDIQYPPSEFSLNDDPQEAVRRAEKLADDLEKKVKDHIDTAYIRWEALPQHRKQDAWILELARSVVKKQTRIETMQEEQHRLRQDNANLRSQIDQLNKLQQPREFKLMTPATLPIDPKFIDFCLEEAVVHGRRTLGMNLDDRRSDIGTVVGTAIDRWKRVVVSHRPSGSGILGKRTVDQAGLNGAPEVHGTKTNGQAPCSPAPCGTRVQPDGAANMNDKDAEADRDDELSDRDANAEKDDGMSDQDADAEMEDDDALGYSRMNHAVGQQANQVPPITPQTEPAGQRRHFITI